MEDWKLVPDSSFFTRHGLLGSLKLWGKSHAPGDLPEPHVGRSGVQ